MTLREADEQKPIDVPETGLTHHASRITHHASRRLHDTHQSTNYVAVRGPVIPPAPTHTSLLHFLQQPVYKLHHIHAVGLGVEICEDTVAQDALRYGADILNTGIELAMDDGPRLGA